LILEYGESRADKQQVVGRSFVLTGRRVNTKKRKEHKEDAQRKNVPETRMSRTTVKDQRVERFLTE
jgi:hypothetical protein